MVGLIKLSSGKDLLLFIVRHVNKTRISVLTPDIEFVVRTNTINMMSLGTNLCKMNIFREF